MTRTRSVVFALATLAMLGAVWRLGRRARPVPTVAVELAPLYERVEREFRGGIAYKPRPDPNFDPTAWALAPLILFESTPAGVDGSAAWEFGRLTRDADGRRVFAPGPLTVYVDASAALVRGQDYPQFTYVWWFRPREAPPPLRAWRRQGVRITLDGSGLPCVWEVLGDTTGARILSVSATLEKRAAADIGKVVRGRRFVVERPLSEFPRVAVVRALSDAPVPLGPWIYVLPDTMDVSTLLCRCMAAQVTPPLELATYPLVSLVTLASGGEPPPTWYDPLGRDDASAAEDIAILAPDWLETCLRLPASF